MADRDDVRNTLNRRAANRHCDACGASTWRDLAPGVLDITFDESLRVHVVVCANCGLVRFHHHQTLMGVTDPPEVPSDGGPDSAANTF